MRALDVITVLVAGWIHFLRDRFFLLGVLIISIIVPMFCVISEYIAGVWFTHRVHIGEEYLAGVVVVCILLDVLFYLKRNIVFDMISPIGYVVLLLQFPEYVRSGKVFLFLLAPTMCLVVYCILYAGRYLTSKILRLSSIE